MSPSHEPWLVALSLFVAFQGSYVGLHLARQIGAARGNRRRSLITASALSFALGIWTMHFVGMLAVRLPIAVDFLVLPTLLSFLVCVLVVGFAVFAVGTEVPPPRRIALAGLSMGAGIVTMHYLGMYALHASIRMAHDPAWVTASIALGVAASGLALWLGFGAGARGSVLLAAVAMALAISAMHYTAMAGMTLSLHGMGNTPEMPAFSPGLLAIVVSIVAFVVSGLFLLTLVPDSQAPDRQTPDRQAPDRQGPLAAVVRADAMAAPDPGGMRPASALGPLVDAAASVRTLPVEKDSRRQQLDVARIVAVQAQAHYTLLFDGETSWFCPLPISTVEARLDPVLFARVHRSHIVKLDRISSLRNAADAAVVAMAARTPYRAPVSRSRRRWLKQLLEQRVHPAQ